MAFICDSRQRYLSMALIWQSSGAASGADLNHVFCKEHFINVPEPQREKAPRKMHRRQKYVHFWSKNFRM